MTRTQKNYLIVGLGLAGTCVGYQLIKKGCKVTFIDSGINHSSRIAAGLINPMVFRRMTKSWRLDEFIPYLNSFYRELESHTNERFFHPITIRRMFSHEQERDLWIKKSSLSEFQNYLEELTEQDDNYDRAANTFGSGRVKNAAYVDVITFLNSMRDWFVQNASVYKEQFIYTSLTGTNYKGADYDGVVFCEGYTAKDNPFFGGLPLGQTKGETLTVKSGEIPEDESVNRKCFVLPLGNQTFKVGSTYIWHTPDTSITDEGRRTLLDNIAGLGFENVIVETQEAGVRPTTIDRRPILGEHPEYKGYYIFNGLGTKGYMIAPLLSEEFANYIMDGSLLNTEVIISRFIGSFNTSSN